MAADAWADGLEEASDGLRPRFEIDVAVSILEAAETRSYWDESGFHPMPESGRSGEHGDLPVDEATRMTDSPNARLVEIPRARHNVHLENPAAWRAAIDAFLDTLPR